MSYMGEDVITYLADDIVSVSNMVIRDGAGGYAITPRRIPTDRTVSMPRPMHELFLSLPYRYPFVRSRSFATVMTEYGCPYGCDFCDVFSCSYE